MAVNPPRSAGAGQSAPVFDLREKTAYGTLRVRRYHRDADPAAFGDLAPLVRLWQARRCGDALPRWKDFAMEDFVGWHRNLALSDVGPEGDPRFRIFGSGMAEVMGGDLTGRKLSESFQDVRQDGVLAHFAAIRQDGLIGLLAGNVGKVGHEHRHFSVVELPLQNDEAEICQILHVCLDTTKRS